MCSLFGLIDFKECLSTHTKNKILNTLARECQVRGTDATGIAYSFNGRLRIYKRPLPARKMKIHIPHGVNAVMGHTRMTTQGNAQFNQNNHPFLGKVDGSSFALAHNGVLWNDKELRMEENLPMTSVETDSYVAVQLLDGFAEYFLSGSVNQEATIEHHAKRIVSDHEPDGVVLI